MKGLSGIAPDEDDAIEALRSAQAAVLPFLNGTPERDVFLLAFKVAQHCVMRRMLTQRCRKIPKTDPAWRQLRREVVRLSLCQSK